MTQEKSQTLRSELPEWDILQDHSDTLELKSIADIFLNDPKRFDKLHVADGALLLDYSKHRITEETMEKLVAFAHACNIEQERDRMFNGDKINVTENRAVLHTALRQQDDTPIYVDGTDIIPDIRHAQKDIRRFSDHVRQERRFKHIVNIGIGGSDLGVKMVYEALKPFSDDHFDLHFVSNIDGAHLSGVLDAIDPKHTLFIVASKTFTTLETITNATSAREWMRTELGTNDVSEHFVAATSNISEATAFGIPQNQIFPFWDWVGGRYSLWSSVGLAFIIACGYENYEKLLRGAARMDTHFKTAPLHKNMPVILALLGLWHRNFRKRETFAICPYDQSLHFLAPYLQQLDMESNGKSVGRDDQKLPYETGPVIIGEVGTNAQHAFFQLLHQGKSTIPCDFVIVAKPQNTLPGHHDILIASALAQSKALSEGQEHDNPHKSFEGGRPSNTLVIDALTPDALGQLIALYEHKIFAQGILWNINSFDQCGVELGKKLALQIHENFSNFKGLETDSSTAGILNHLKHLHDLSKKD